MHRRQVPYTCICTWLPRVNHRHTCTAPIIWEIGYSDVYILRFYADIYSLFVCLFFSIKYPSLINENENKTEKVRIKQSDKRFLLHSKTTECTRERLSSHSSRDFWLRCWKDRSSGICSELHASRVTILEFLAKISSNLRENSRVIPASSTQNSCEFGGFVAWKKWNIHAGHLKIRSFPTIVL